MASCAYWSNMWDSFDIVKVCAKELLMSGSFTSSKHRQQTSRFALNVSLFVDNDVSHGKVSAVGLLACTPTSFPRAPTQVVSRSSVTPLSAQSFDKVN